MKKGRFQRLTAKQAEKMLLQSEFKHIRSKGSHRIYQKGSDRFIVPFRSGKVLHPKIIKNLIELLNS